MLKVCVRRQFSHNGYGIWLIRYTGPNYGTCEIAKKVDLEWEPHSEVAMFPPEPTILIPGPEMQGAIESLIKEIEMAGLRTFVDPSSAQELKDQVTYLRSLVDRLEAKL